MPLKNTREVPLGPDERTPEAAEPAKTGPAVIAHYLKTLPGSPGVYRMLDAAGTVIYVGKARNLKARVTSYARAGNHANRITRMISVTASMEFVTVRTEAEALLLEANLIKRFRPRYNVLLQGRQVLPLHSDRARAQGRRRSSSIAVRATARATTSGRSPRPAPSIAPSTCWSGRSCCARARTPYSRAARGPACSTRSSAARRPARARSGSRTTARWSRRRRASSRARARMRARCTSG